MSSNNLKVVKELIYYALFVGAGIAVFSISGGFGFMSVFYGFFSGLASAACADTTKMGLGDSSASSQAIARIVMNTLSGALLGLVISPGLGLLFGALAGFLGSVLIEGAAVTISHTGSCAQVDWVPPSGTKTGLDYPCTRAWSIIPNSKETKILGNSEEILENNSLNP